MIRVGVGVSAGSSKEQQDKRNQQQQGSTLAAGESVILKTRQDIESQDGSIAGKNVVLNAGRDISLTAALDTEQQKTAAAATSTRWG